jgi:hypothetical protein
VQAPNTKFWQNGSSNFKDKKRMAKDFLHFEQTIKTKNAAYLQVVLLSWEETHEKSLKIK